MTDEQELEPGWEFILPEWIAKPYNWLLVILVVVALILSIMLFNKMQAAKSNQTGAQFLPQVTNPK